MQRISTLDLFSGIGGFALGLRRVCQTVGYCESDEKCQKVLEKNMLRGKLDNAPIFGDVRFLKAKDLLEKNILPRMVTIGSPCTDVSVANVGGKGIDGVHSRLLFDAIRLVKTVPSIELMLLENSANIRRRGESDVVTALRKAGFKSVSLILSAESLGAYHKRRRWFCLAWKSRPDDLRPPPIKHIWKLPKERLTPCGNDVKKCRKCIHRCSMLGNAVVPQCAYSALRTLIFTNRGETLQISAKRAQLNLCFTDGTASFTKQLWATPCANEFSWYVYTLSERSAGLLATQLVYERGTRLPSEPTRFVANPSFVEALCGFPKNWTNF